MNEQLEKAKRALANDPGVTSVSTLRLSNRAATLSFTGPHNEHFSLSILLGMGVLLESTERKLIGSYNNVDECINRIGGHLYY